MPTPSVHGRPATPGAARAAPRGTGAALLLALLVTACGGDGAADGDTASGPQPVAVTWAEAQPQELREVRDLVGSLEARSRPLITAEVAGVVAAVHQDEGDRVESGDLLAEIETGDYRDERDRAAAEVAQMTARVQVQEHSVRRARELHADEHLSEDELDQAEAELASRQAQLDAARSALRSAERALARTRIRAEIGGVVDERHISEGDYLRAGDPAFELVDDQRLRARLSASQALAPRIRQGAELRLHNPSAAEPEIQATVTDLRPRIQASTRSLHILADFENPGGWRPGASLEGELLLDERQAIVVPAQSIARRPDGDTVYVLNDAGDRVEARTVALGTRQADRVEVRSGLAPGERFVVDGARLLSDGAPVQATAHEAEAE